MALLREKQRQLAEVEATIAALEAKFNETVAEKESLENNIALTSARLNRAGRLNIALGDEQSRWEESVKVGNFRFTISREYRFILIILEIWHRVRKLSW